MTRATLLHVLESPTDLGPDDVRELERLAQAFPYCQTAHLLLAKAAHDQGTMLAGQRLRRAATYAADRTLLRRLIEQARPQPEPQPEPVAPHNLVDREGEFVPAAPVVVSEALPLPVSVVEAAPAPPAPAYPAVMVVPAVAAVTPFAVEPVAETATMATTAAEIEFTEPFVAALPIAHSPVLNLAVEPLDSVSSGLAQAAPAGPSEVTAAYAVAANIVTAAGNELPLVLPPAPVATPAPAIPTAPSAAMEPEEAATAEEESALLPAVASESALVQPAAQETDTLLTPIAIEPMMAAGPLVALEFESALPATETTLPVSTATPADVATATTPAEGEPGISTNQSAPVAVLVPEAPAPAENPAVVAATTMALPEASDEPIATAADEPDLPAQAPAIRPPAEAGAARFEYGLAEPPPQPAGPAYELPGLVDEWASAAVTLSLAGPELRASAVPAAVPATPVFTPAAFTGDAAVGYAFGESSRLGLSMQLLDLLTAKAETAEAATAVVAAAQPAATPLPPTGMFFEPDPLLLDHWATHRPTVPEPPTTIDLINNFLRRQPRLTRPAMLPPAAAHQADLSVRSTRAEPDLVSENLARIFVRQGKTARAIEIYEKLMVKQPEKMAYFAAQIQSLQPSA